MGYLRKWDKMSKENPHTIIHMNPLFRNPGSAPAYGGLSTIKSEIKLQKVQVFARPRTK